MEFCRGPDGACFLVTLWWLWRARCTLVLEGENWPMHRVLMLISSYVVDIMGAYDSSRLMPHQ